MSSRQIEKIIDKQVAEALEHFNDQENGGWQLDKSFIKSEIFRKVFNVTIEDEIDQAFINAGLSISYRSDGSFVELEDGYKPIYFNERTGKIKVVENSDDKGYIFKYSGDKGWTHIGRL